MHDAPIDHIVRHTLAGRLPPAAAVLPGLPQRFVAVRFMFSRSFPETDSNRAWLDTLLASLTQTRQVVWLGANGESIGSAGQGEYAPSSGVPVHHIDYSLAAERSIALQAAVIARADAYIGTYDGMSHVAPFYGVRSVAFYAIRNFFPHHRSVAEHMCGGRQHRLLAVLSIADHALLRRVLNIAPPTTAAVSP